MNMAIEQNPDCKNHALINEVARRLADWPLYSQEEMEEKLVVVKLFNAFGAGTWFLVEYNPETKIGFGYVTGFGYDEWGYVNLNELAELQFCGAPVIEIDAYLPPTPFNLLVKKWRSGFD